MSRWLTAFFVAVLGFGLGLTYASVWAPVEYVDTTPSSLRADFRADYVLMVAERFEADRDPEAAIRRLSVLGVDTPSELCAEALRFAHVSSYAPGDLELLRRLQVAVQGHASSLAPAAALP